MDKQERIQSNTYKNNNQLLIDYIKDTYTIESSNKVFFLFQDKEMEELFISKKTIKSSV